jgi:hypothetical protein
MKFALSIAFALSMSTTASAQSLSVSGACPGPMTISASGLAPGEAVALLSSNGPGSATMPGGPCAGSATGLSPSGLALRSTGAADGGGNYSLSPTIPGAACGAMVQVVSLSACGVMTPPAPLAGAECERVGWKYGDDGDWSCPAGMRMPTILEWDAVAACVLPEDDAKFDYYHDVATEVGGCNCKWNPGWCGQASIETIRGGRMCGDFDQLQICVK